MSWNHHNRRPQRPAWDCGAASQACVFGVGYRESASGGGRYHLTGTITSLALYVDSVLSAFPRVVDGLRFFSLVEAAYISGRNMAEHTYVTLEECVRLCRAEPRCNSFDMGRPGGTREGWCLLSEAFESRIAPEFLRISTNYDYYERTEARICTQ